MPTPAPNFTGAPRTCQDGSSLCGGDCCPANFICNKNIPGIEFCDVPSDPNIGAGVTAVSQLGFKAQAFNTSVRAKPTSFGSNTLYTATTAVMEGTGPYSQKTAVSKSLTGSSGGSMSTSSAVASGASAGTSFKASSTTNAAAASVATAASAGAAARQRPLVIQGLLVVGGVAAVVLL